MATSLLELLVESQKRKPPRVSQDVQGRLYVHSRWKDTNQRMGVSGIHLQLCGIIRRCCKGSHATLQRLFPQLALNSFRVIPLLQLKSCWETAGINILKVITVLDNFFSEILPSPPKGGRKTRLDTWRSCWGSWSGQDAQHREMT